METYKFTLLIEVDVDAYSVDDATDMLEDIFGPGSDCGAEVKSLKIRES